MSNTATIYLPLSTWVHVRAFTNAAFSQQVVIAFEDGTPTRTLIGSGEHDAPMPNGDFGVTTPPKSSSPLGYRVSVAVSTQAKGGWQPSMVSQGSCSVMFYELAMVVSEDYEDQDWNDAVVLFSWWRPASVRTEDAARQLS